MLSEDREEITGRLRQEHREDPERLNALEEARTAAAVGEVTQGSATNYHLHVLIVIGIYILGFAGLLMLLSLFYNLAASSNWRFLTDDQTAKLQSFLLSGVIGSAITALAKKIVK